jgi:pimeloyl-ACP methyl ester carboxylesterase
MSVRPQSRPAEADPAAIVADYERRARRYETPCGEGVMVWRAWGSGAPLLVTHGSHGAWSHWIRNLDALSATRTVWAPDLPGMGESAPPPAPTHEAISAVLAAGLRRLIGPDLPVDVLGFSFGGVAAAHLAALQPGTVRRLILVGAGGLDTPVGRVEMHRVRGLEGEARTEALRLNLLGLMLRHRASADALAVHLQELNGFRGRLNPAELVLPDRLIRILPEVPCQVDAMWGEHDRPHPDPALQLAALHRVRPDAELRVVEDAGHWAMYERPEAFDRAALELLDQPLRTPA